MILSQLLILIVACSFSLAVLVPLDEFNTKAIDQLVRKELLEQILFAVNDTIKLQERLQGQCSHAINATIDQCKACANSRNPNSAPSGDVLTVALPVLLGPVTQTAKLLKGVERTLGDAVSVMGDTSKQFVEDVGSVAKNAGENLVHGAGDLLKGTFDGLKGVGKTFGNLAKNLGSGLVSIPSGVLDSTLGLGVNFAKTLSSGASFVTDVVGDVGKQVGKVGKTITGVFSGFGKGIGSIFGKRRRRSVCPSCDKINPETSSPEEIVKQACGEELYQRQQQLVAELKKMDRIYTYAVESQVIQKIEYDPASIDVSNGVAFRTVSVTYSFGTESRYQSDTPLQMTNQTGTAAGLTEEIYSRG